jgi:hypothetical protein
LMYTKQSHFSILFSLTRIIPYNLKIHEGSFSRSRGQGYRSCISLWPVKNVADLAVESTLVMNVKFEYAIVAIKFGFYVASRKLTSRHASASSAPAPWFILLC